MPLLGRHLNPDRDFKIHFLRKRKAMRVKDIASKYQMSSARVSQIVYKVDRILRHRALK